MAGSFKSKVSMPLSCLKGPGPSQWPLQKKQGPDALTVDRAAPGGDGSEIQEQLLGEWCCPCRPSPGARRP